EVVAHDDGVAGRGPGGGRKTLRLEVGHEPVGGAAAFLGIGRVGRNRLDADESLQPLAAVLEIGLHMVERSYELARHIGLVGAGFSRGPGSRPGLQGGVEIVRGIIAAHGRHFWTNGRGKPQDEPPPSCRTKAMRSMLVAPGVPSGMPAVIAMRSPGRASPAW